MTAIFQHPFKMHSCQWTAFKQAREAQTMQCQSTGEVGGKTIQFQGTSTEVCWTNHIITMKLKLRSAPAKIKWFDEKLIRSEMTTGLCIIVMETLVVQY